MSIDENNPTNTTTAQPAAADAAPVTAPSATVPSEPTQAAPVDGGNGGTVTEQPRPRRRGFAAMDRDRVKEIASKGGRAAHAAGTAHQFSADEARVAGKKGGLAPHVRRGGVRRRPITEAAAPVSQSGLNGQH